MNVRFTLWALGLLLPALADAQSKTDSAAKADSAAVADSLALIATLEQELAQDATDSTAGNTAPARAPGGYMNVGFVALSAAGWSTEPDVRSLQRGDHDPAVRGFTIQNTELTLDGAVDPYFKGFSNIIFKIDENGETGIELEEAYALTSALPANLQLKAGQFFVEFGRQNLQHPHSWAFVDQPLVLNRMFGPDGLRSQGIRLSWLVPVPFYTEALLTVANSVGETAASFRSEESAEIHGGIAAEHQVLGFRDMLLVPRLATSFDISDTQTLLFGVSGAFGPNNSGSTSVTRIFGADGYWKWKPAAAQQGFPFISLQAEAITRRYEADERLSAENPLERLPAETLQDRGAYGQVLWGIKPRLVAGLRSEFAKGDESSFASDLRNDRVRVSPNFTWYPTEFSKFRVQYNYDDRKGIGRDHSLWFQFEFLLGAHASHKF